MKLKDLEWKEFVENINRIYEGGWEGTPEELLEIEVMTGEEMKWYIKFLEERNYE